MQFKYDILHIYQTEYTELYFGYYYSETYDILRTG